MAVTLLAKLWTFVPAAAVVCYAFLTFRTDDTAVVDYIIHACSYFLLSQQEYRWEEN